MVFSVQHRFKGLKVAFIVYSLCVFRCNAGGHGRPMLNAMFNRFQQQQPPVPPPPPPPPAAVRQTQKPTTMTTTTITPVRPSLTPIIYGQGTSQYQTFKHAVSLSDTVQDQQFSSVIGGFPLLPI